MGARIMLKRILCLCICLLTVFAVCACGGGEGSEETPAASSEAVSGLPSEQPSEEPTESSEVSEEVEEPVRILFLGNSFTYYNDLPGMFGEIAASAGKQVEVVGVTIGSARLDWFVTSSESVCKQLNQVLEETVFDYVFLQEHSTRPYKDYALFERGAVAVLKKIRKSSPDCKAILYETWGFHEENESIRKEGMTTRAQEQKLLDAYETLAEEIGAAVSYAGVSVYRVYKDAEYDPYHEDLKHPSYVGTLAAALTHFYTLFPEAEKDSVTFRGEVSDDCFAAVAEIAYAVAHDDAVKSHFEAMPEE